MPGHTDNSIVVDAPIDFTWTITNDVAGWPDLFTEYAKAEILTDDDTGITFRLTMHPDENGQEWSWVSRRVPDRETWSVQAERVEPGPFRFMNIRWTYEAEAPDRTRMRWVQDFAMRPDAPVDDAQMTDRMNANTAIQMAVVKANVEARRRRMLGEDDVAPNLRRGGDLRVLLSPGTVGSTSGFSGVAIVQPGDQINEHYHPYSEEFLHVVDGELRVDLNGEPVLVPAGQALFVPREVRHRLVNLGATPARVVFFLSPLAPRPDLGHVDTE